MTLKKPINKKYIVMAILVESDGILNEEDCQHIMLDVYEKLEELSDDYFDEHGVNTRIQIEGFASGDTNPLENIDEDY
jgi:hypothetical protein